MNNSNTILNELREISPVVAEIGTRLPYEVPAGYFDGLAAQVLARVKEEEVSAVLPQQKNNPYEVPRGYFDNFAADMLQRVKALETASAKDELEALSPLLSSLGKKTPYSAPDGYFEDLTDNAVAGAKAIDFVNVELENLSPMMSSLKGRNVYQVPAAYFEQLPAAMLAKAKQQSGKVVSMNFTRRVVRYAAAAVVAGLIIAAAWLFIGQGNSGGEQTLAGIEEVSDEALVDFLANQTVSPAETSILASATVELKAEDLQEMLAEVPDDELIRYASQFAFNDIITN